MALFGESANQSTLNSRAVGCDADAHRVGACVRGRERMRVVLQEASSISVSMSMLECIPTTFVTWQNLKSLHPLNCLSDTRDTARQVAHSAEEALTSCSTCKSQHTA
jgi:hypothetical protein